MTPDRNTETQTSFIDARRRLCREFGATIATAIASQPFTTAELAESLGCTEGKLRSLVFGLLDGGTSSTRMSEISAILFVCGCRIELSLRRIPSDSGQTESGE